MAEPGPPGGSWGPGRGRAREARLGSLIEEYNFDGTIRHNRGLKQFAIQPGGGKSHTLGNFKYAGQGASEVPL